MGLCYWRPRCQPPRHGGTGTVHLAGLLVLPPADALRTRLAHQPDLLALNLHVDYWDGGRRRPYSLPVFTARRQRYTTLLAGEGVYTPELVAGGLRGVVGSDPQAMAAAAAAAKSAPQYQSPCAATRTSSPSMSQRQWRRHRTSLAGDDAGHETRALGAENCGRVLSEENVMRSLQPAAR